MYLYLVKRRQRHNAYYYYCYSQTGRGIFAQNRQNSPLKYIIINLDAIAPAAGATAVIRGTQTNRVVCADNGEIE